MQLGISTAAFYGLHETEEAAGLIAGFTPRFDCAEVFLQTVSEYSLSFAQEVRKRLEGLPCSSVHPQGTQFENGLFSRSPRQRRDALDQFRRILDAAAILGASRYVYHGRYTALLKALPFDAQRNADVVGLLCEEAAARGMKIAWENVFWCQLTTPERVTAMRRLLPQVCFTLDIKQAMRAGVQPADFLPVMGDALCNVHLCDWKADQQLCLPGEGVFDFMAFGRALSGMRYSGPVILEPYAGLIRDEGSLDRAAAFLRRVL